MNINETERERRKMLGDTQRGKRKGAFYAAGKEVSPEDMENH